MPNVFIFANSQGSVLRHFIPNNFVVTYIRNYSYVFDRELNEEIKNYLTDCDFFIYQPISSLSYPVYNTDNLKKYLKVTCKAISFPYIFNNAFTPIYRFRMRDNIINDKNTQLVNDETLIYGNKEPILKLKKEGFSLEQILEKYDFNEIDFCYKERFEYTMNILQEKEKLTDVKVYQFILDNHKKFRLFNYHDDGFITYCNHPSNFLINYYANQILLIMGLNSVNYIGGELLTQTTLISRYDINYYNYEYVQKEDDYINKILKQIITEIYENY